MLVTLAAVVAIMPGLIPVIIGVIHAAQGGEPSLLGPALIAIGLLAPTSWVGAPGWAYMLLPVAIPLYLKRMERRRP